MKAFLKFAARLSLRYAWLISLIALVAAGVGARYTALLYQNLRTDFEELLPETARSVEDLEEISRRLEALESLTVLVFSDDPEASRRFVDDLAAELREAPRSTVAWVEYRIDQEIEFFGDRRALYLSVEDLRRVRRYIRDRIDYERELYNPLNIFSGVELREPFLDFAGLSRKYESQAVDYTRFPEGYYATTDEKVRALLAYLPGKVSGVEGALRLQRTVDEAVARLNPESYAPDLRVRYTGGVRNLIEERASILQDIGLITAVVAGLVTLVILLYFRSPVGVSCLLTSLLAGTLYTLGVSYYLIGYLNANSAFLGSIVVGNGVNYGLIYLARYVEERREGKGHHRAIYAAMTGTAFATLVASLAAGSAYGSLFFTEFRGFKQFGGIGFIGMVLCWLSAYTVLPALLTAAWKMGFLRGFTRTSPGASSARRRNLAAWLVAKAPVPLVVISLALTAASIYSFRGLDPGTLIESDITRLRSQRSQETGSASLSPYIDRIFQRYMSPTVFLPRSEEEARALVRRLREKKEREGEESLIGTVSYLEDFVPENQREKIRILKQIRSMLNPRVTTRLSPEDRRRVRDFLNPAAFTPISREDLPELLLRRFRERDGTIGNLVLVEPPLTHELDQAEMLIRYIRELREVADSISPGMPVASQQAVAADIFHAITRDGPRATLAALIAVVVIVFALFRLSKVTLWVLSALFMGSLWVFGIILSLKLRINFLNFIALPMTFGIGADYAVNIFQRERLERGKGIITAVRDTGGAVALASLTTIIGYGSLILADNRAFVSFGIFSTLGEVTCLVAAILSVPALVHLLQRRRMGKKNRAVAGESESERGKPAA